MAFQLDPLPYYYDSLEPYIDTLTMQIHHDKHHAAYISNLNAALEKHPELNGKRLDDLIANLSAIPDDIRQVVRNHGGGTWNHNQFWAVMSPMGKGGQPSGELIKAIETAFGSLDTFKSEFEKSANSRFGSGWAWLIKRADGLSIVSTPNQDNPLLDAATPLLGLDVWEHAYYLKYQNRRAEYVSNWWNVVNWEEVTRRFSAK